jgi:hypothetical protein
MIILLIIKISVPVLWFPVFKHLPSEQQLIQSPMVTWEVCFLVPIPQMRKLRPKGRKSLDQEYLAVPCAIWVTSLTAASTSWDCHGGVLESVPTDLQELLVKFWRINFESWYLTQALF